ncbi:hypothetical protein ANO11243_023740 [Dothideomycetidae sp. 11243]|nr:hypothetical protein ANO11243_023740 [fungal sp. No.11243]
MAPSQEGSFYLPPLDQCLQGRQALMFHRSWRNIYTSLSDPSSLAVKVPVDRALKDDGFRAFLVEPWSAFTQATPATKAQFETRTAAINVPTPDQGQYDVAEFKEDALWLAKEVAVDEVTALRVVLLEWQQRPDQALLSQWFEDEIQSLRASAAAPGIHAISELVNLHGGCTTVEEADDARVSKTRRQMALLLLYFQERQYLLKASETVAGIAQRAELQVPASTSLKSPTISQEVRHMANSIWKSQTGSPNQDPFERSVSMLRSLLDAITDAQKWPSMAKGNEEVAVAHTSALLEQFVSFLRLAYLHLGANRGVIPNVSQVRLWYTLVDETSFLAAAASVSSQTPTVNQAVQALVALISVEILRLTPTLDYIRERLVSQDHSLYPDLPQQHYIQDEDCVRQITGCLLGAALNSIEHASPAVFVWSVVCHTLRMSLQQDNDGSHESALLTRRGSLRGTDLTKLSRPEIILKSILDINEVQDPIAEMGRAAIRMHVFDIVTAILEVITNLFRLPSDIHTIVACKMTAFEVARHAVPAVVYGPEIVTSLLATMSFVPPPSSTIDGRTELITWPMQPAQSLHEDHYVLGPRLMPNLISRYPHELDSFLLCLSAVSRSPAYVDEEGSQIVRLLENLTTFTTVLPRGFDAYDLMQDEDMMNCIRTTQPIPILMPLHPHSSTSTNPNGQSDSRKNTPEYVIPAGTIGTVMNNERPLVVSWQYPHSGLEFLGALLSTLSPNASLKDVRATTDLDLEAAADIVGLCNSMLIGTLSVKDTDAAKDLLGQLSNGLARNDDIIRIVFDIFEDQLQGHMAQPGSERSVLFLTRVIEFARLVLDIFPERIWTILSRSKLLPMDDNPGALSAIVGATEIPRAEFDFLHACVSLFGALIDDCLERSVSRNAAVGAKAVARFEVPTTSGGVAPEKVMSSLLFNFSRVTLDVLQSQSSWRFSSPQQRHDINCCVLSSMNELLHYAHGSDTADGKSRLLSVFHAAAANVASAYLTDTAPGMPIQSLLEIFVNALIGLWTLPDSRDNHEIVAVTVQALTFGCSLMRTGILQSRPGLILKKHLYKALPLVARLYVAHDALKPHVAEFLTLLVQYSDTSSEEPLSLLGHLPSQTAKSFLKVVTEVEKPLQNLETEASIWDMLSAIVSHKQQWLAICLLTGSTPRERLQKDGQRGGQSNKSLVDIALGQLLSIATLPPRRAIAILAFLSHAQRHWTWISTTVSDHKDILPVLCGWLAGLAPNSRPSDVEACIRNANENQMAAFVTDILARFFHNLGGSGKAEQLKGILPRLKYLRDHASSVDGYNQSLHKNLAKNFEQKFPSCSLDDFKRSSFRPNPLGRDYYYDLELADRMLGFDSSWRRVKGQGFADEMGRANVNFSVVDSQIALLRSWKSLALGISTIAGKDAEDDVVTIVSGCLRSNIETTTPSHLFENVSNIRSEFAFALLQGLVRNKSRSQPVKNIFFLAWDAVRRSGLDFEVIETPRDAAYYRMLLQILFLALQPHADSTANPSSRQTRESLTKSATTVPAPLTPLGSTFLEIISKVIATNFRALCRLVHAAGSSKASSTLAESSDFVLLTAILQSILQTPSAATMQRQIASTIADSGLIRYAMSLYSWSDSLTPGDPIYGELSILFLLTLSSIPLAAEQMAVEGVLSSLSSANLSQHFRAPSTGVSQRGGKGPFDEPARLHTIWARGVLPLCQNILYAVGPGVASDVAAFLNGFSQQLTRCESDVESGPSLNEARRGSMTLALASEIHSTALISAILDSLRSQGATAGINPAQLVPLAFDKAAVKDSIEQLLKSRRVLKDRIVPIGDREVALARRLRGNNTDGGSALEELIVVELKGALTCLQPV